MNNLDAIYDFILKELTEFCDKFFANDSEVENYCVEKSIPFDN